MNLPEKSIASEGKHSLSLKNREKLSLDGVLEVLSFDEGGVHLKTALGNLVLEGEGLHITKLLLDTGDVTVEGKISALFYEEGRGKSRSSFLGRLFG